MNSTFFQKFRFNLSCKDLRYNVYLAIMKSTRTEGKQSFPEILNSYNIQAHLVYDIFLFIHFHPFH